MWKADFENQKLDFKELSFDLKELTRYESARVGSFTEVIRMTSELNFKTTVAPLEEALHAGNVEKMAAGPIVLIVDSDRLAADTWGAIFRLHGYRVDTAYDGASGFTQAKMTRPDLLITSVSILGMNGVELALLVQEALPACKILLFAGQSPEEMLAAAGASEYGFQTVLRPVHPTQMLQRAAAWLQAA